MKVIIAGGRDFHNYFIMENVLKQLHSIDEVVCGDAQGADTLGMRWAIYNNIPIWHMPALWDKYGKNAGFIRNAEMGEYADALIAFWDGKSKGTKHMIQTMRLNKKPYMIFNYYGNRIDETGKEIDDNGDYSLACPW